MRIVILSIAFLFLAFSAKSQVLKSAGVWYFLDVDSMTARPAVLPNGTELAYVVGTKTVYYWNRNTSTWTAYGSTFNRDSIYFDSSIAGSGTIGDPWRVDSTLFATIAAVGDSIAAALGYVAANYFPLEGGTLTGTGGAGFIGFPSQGVAPGAPSSGLNVYAQSSSFNWKGTDGFERQITSSPTGGRNYALPDINGTFALGTGTADRLARWTGTNTLAAGNLSDNATRLQALLPWQFHSWNNAGRPTGVTGYAGYNTNGNGIEWYQGSRWAKVLESTFNRGTATRIPFFDANGQITERAGFTFNNGAMDINTGTLYITPPPGTTGYSSAALGILTSNANAIFVRGTTTGALVQIEPSNSATLGFYLLAATDNNYRTFLAQRVSSTVGVGTGFRMSVAPSGVSDSQVSYEMGVVLTENNSGSSRNDLVFRNRRTDIASERMRLTDMGFLGLSTANPLQELDVNGDAYVRDSTRLTTTPAHTSITGLLTRNTDGWVGLASLAGGLSYSGGVLTGANGIYSGSGTLSSTNTYAAMDSAGIKSFSVGYFPDFPSLFNNSGEKGLFISPSWNDVALIHNTLTTTQVATVTSNRFYLESSFNQDSRNVSVFGSGGSGFELLVSGSALSDKSWALNIDSSKFSITRNISGTNRTYNILPASNYPVTGSGLKQNLVWTAGTPDFEYIKKDTTIFVTADTDYDFSAAVTTSQIASRYNRIIIHMTLTSGVGADKTTTLHTPDANLMQCEILIRGTDNTGTYDNEIAFGTNNAISSDGTNTSGYTLAQGQGLHVRVVYNGSAYKYIYY